VSEPRYFLVRREAREFIGPMKIDEFKQRLDRLEFGMQDEVSGHCGPWIVLDHRDEMIKHYPEIAKIFGENVSLSWRETTGHAKVMSRKDSRKDKKNELDQQKKSRNDFHRYMELRRRKSLIRIRLAVVTLGVAIGAGAWIILNKEETPDLAEIQALAQKSDPAEFLNTMGIKVIPKASRLAKSQKTGPLWTPYLRMYAYFTTGAIEGVSQRQLRGDAPATSPVDCSVDSWKRRWKDNSGAIISFIKSTSLQKNPWTKLLSIDPHWIRRRPSRSWIKPKSYLEGCIMTAHTAMRSMSIEKNQEGAEVIPWEISSTVLDRLKFQLEVITAGRATALKDKEDTLAQMSCFEGGNEMLTMENCRQEINDQFKPLMDEKYAFSILRQIIEDKSSDFEKKWGPLVGALLPKMVSEDFMNRFDVKPELKLMGYLNSYGDVGQALTRIIEEYPEMNF
jgi:hypothetical protein